MHGVIRAASYSLMTMFVSCGVGAQDPGTQSSTGFTATPEEARGIGHCQGSLGPRLQDLLRACYSREPTEDQAQRRLRQSLATLQSQAKHNNESAAPALRPLNPVHEKDSP